MNSETLCKNCFACIYYEHECKMLKSPLEIETTDRCVMESEEFGIDERFEEHQCFVPSAYNIMNVDLDFRRKWESVREALDYYETKYNVPK